MNLYKNLFSEKQHEEYQKIIFDKIPELKNCEHNNYFSLIDYFIKSPNKFFMKNEANIFYEFFNSTLSNEEESKRLFSSLSINLNDLDHAIKILDEVNSKDIHEYVLPEYDIELMSHIGDTFLYEYLKITDSILLGLIKPIAYFIRINSNKGVDKLDIFNCVETLNTIPNFKFLNNYYNHTIRNSIAHGNVKFKKNNLEFKDRKKKTSCTSKEFIQKFDSLIDLLNGLTYAYKRFFLINFISLDEWKVTIPSSIKEKELKIKSNHVDWEILYSYESQIQKGSQYNLYINTTLNSRSFMNLSAYHTASYLEMLFPKKYDTLFLHIKTKFKMPCWQIFDMKKLRAYVNENKIDNITDGTFFFDEGFFSKKKDYLKTLKYLFPDVLNIYSKSVNEKYIKYHCKKYYNVIENHSIYLNTNNFLNVEDYIRINTRMFLNNAVTFKNKNSKNFTKEKHFPTKYIRVYIYSKDNRKRAFKMSQVNEYLIAILQYNRSKKIKNILPSFGIKEENKHCLIFWNKSHPVVKQGGITQLKNQW